MTNQTTYHPGWTWRLPFCSPSSLSSAIHCSRSSWNAFNPCFCGVVSEWSVIHFKLYLKIVCNVFKMYSLAYWHLIFCIYTLTFWLCEDNYGALIICVIFLFIWVSLTYNESCLTHIQSNTLAKCNLAVYS